MPKASSSTRAIRSPASRRRSISGGMSAKVRTAANPSLPSEYDNRHTPFAMRKGDRTKRAMVGAAVDLMQRKGIAATGMREVVETAGAPRGSIGFHFPGGKEQLAVEAVEAASRGFERVIAQAFAEAPSPAVAVERFAALMAAGLEASGFERGCPLATT